MKEIFLRYKELILEMGASLLLVLGGALWSWLTLRGIKEPLIIHFSSYTGINQIGSLSDLLAISVTAAIIIFLNAAVGWELEHRHKPLARMVGLTTLFLAALLFIGFVAIISVNS